MSKVTDLEANLEQFKIEQVAINSEAAKQRALLQATIEKNKVEVDRQFAEITNALKALQPPTTLPEDTTTMIDTEKSGEDSGNLEEFMVADVWRRIWNSSRSSRLQSTQRQRNNWL
ncbi:hypothetical protein Tco_0423103, partial [Tanacetum coccineum]